MKKNYFNSLNYTIGNEDTSLELKILPENTGHILAAAGSGSRIIPLMAKNPRNITCVDSSSEQLSFSEIRIASLKSLDYQKFLGFWGYPSSHMSSVERQAIFEKLVVSDLSKKYMSSFFEKRKWDSILYAGRWEQTFGKLSKMIRWINGKKGTGIFNCLTEKEQEVYLKNKFPKNKWMLSIFLLGNSVIFNALLYKGAFPKKNIPQSIRKFYLERFDHLFNQGLTRKNYFLQLLFFGRLRFSEGMPLECDPLIFSQAKKWSSNIKIEYKLGDILEETKRIGMKVDFLSFSDIPSYFEPPQEQNFLQEIRDNISTNGIVVSRYYLHIPHNLVTDGYHNITKNYTKDINKEKIQMYSFGIYQKR